MTNIYVLHNGHKYGGLTCDCKKRLQAAGKYATGIINKKIFFVGGSGLDGGRVMLDCWQTAFPCLSSGIIMLNKSKTTWENIEEIKTSLENNPAEKSVVITSDYHIKRVEYILGFFAVKGCRFRVFSAESILGIEKSSALKFIAEIFLFMYQHIDPKQKIPKLIRFFTYREKIF